MCEQRLSGVDAAVILVAIVLKYIFRVRSVFLQATCATGGVTVGACLA